MKIKTLFFTSILAAAAMSAVPAWANIYQWKGGESGTWDYSTKKWYVTNTGSSNVAFAKDNDARFDVSSAEDSLTMTVGADISAKTAYLYGKGTLTLTRAANTSYKVSISENRFWVGNANGDNATLKYGAEDMIAGEIRVYLGTLDLNEYSADSASIVVSEGGTLKLSVNTDAATNAKAVSFSEGAKLVLDLSNVSIASGATLSILSTSESEIQYIKNKTASALTASDADNLLAVGSSNLGKYADWKREWTVEKTTKGSTLKLTLTNSAVPEPSMFGLLAGAGALAFVAARRRRRVK